MFQLHWLIHNNLNTFVYMCLTNEKRVLLLLYYDVIRFIINLVLSHLEYF